MRLKAKAHLMLVYLLKNVLIGVYVAQVIQERS